MSEYKCEDCCDSGLIASTAAVGGSIWVCDCEEGEKRRREDRVVWCVILAVGILAVGLALVLLLHVW